MQALALLAKVAKKLNCSTSKSPFIQPLPDTFLTKMLTYELKIQPTVATPDKLLAPVFFFLLKTVCVFQSIYKNISKSVWDASPAYRLIPICIPSPSSQSVWPAYWSGSLRMDICPGLAGLFAASGPENHCQHSKALQN